MRKQIAAANWKMNLTLEEANEFKAKVKQNGNSDAWLLIQEL